MKYFQVNGMAIRHANGAQTPFQVMVRCSGEAPNETDVENCVVHGVHFEHADEVVVDTVVSASEEEYTPHAYKLDYRPVVIN